MANYNTTRLLLYYGVILVFVAFVGDVLWKQSAIKPLPLDKLQPFFRVAYGIPNPKQRILHAKWTGGETKIDQNNPDVVWYKPSNSNKWLRTPTEELAMSFAKANIEASNSTIHITAK